MKNAIQTGFTLIELMIVVAIVGILAAIALPAYQDYTARAQLSEAFTLLSGVRVSVAEYLFVNGSLPADNNTAGLVSAMSITGNYISSVTVTNAGIEFQVSNNAAAPISNGTLIVEPVLDTGGDTIVRWECRSTNIADRFIPTSCRP